MKQADANSFGATSFGAMQTTIASAVTMSGVGVHSGRHTVIKLHPASADTGILFYRADIGDDDGYVLAHASNAIETQLCTTIKNNNGTEVRMIEHLMAAFHGLGVDNLVVELDGPEVPIFDGSSANIVDAIHHVGIIALDSHRTYLEVVAPVRVELDAGTWAQLIPAPSLQLDISINFTDPGIGEQSYRYDSRDEHFSTEIAHARTFCVYSDVEKMRRAGLGKGGSLENALVYDNGILMNEGGLRMENECVKHKALDCIGDLYLAGMTIKGLLIAERPGHRLSTLLVQALLRDESAYRIVSSDEDVIASTADTIQMTLAASA